MLENFKKETRAHKNTRTHINKHSQIDTQNALER